MRSSRLVQVVDAIEKQHGGQQVRGPAGGELRCKGVGIELVPSAAAWVSCEDSSGAIAGDWA